MGMELHFQPTLHFQSWEETTNSNHMDDIFYFSQLGILIRMRHKIPRVRFSYFVWHQCAIEYLKTLWHNYKGRYECYQYKSSSFGICCSEIGSDL